MSGLPSSSTPLPLFGRTQRSKEDPLDYSAMTLAVELVLEFVDLQKFAIELDNWLNLKPNKYAHSGL